jgi:hypothetical protein
VTIDKAKVSGIISLIEQRRKYTEESIKRLASGNNVTVGPGDVATLLVHNCLNQLAIMQALEALVLGKEELDNGKV